MSVEKFIHTHESYAEGGQHDHPSLASQRRAMDTAKQKEWEHEQEDLIYYEKRYGEVVNDQLIPFDYHEVEVFRSYE